MKNMFHASRGAEIPLRFASRTNASPPHKHRARIVLALAIPILLALFVASGARPVVAQSGGGYDLTWNVIAGGGATFSTGGAYSLGGTIGQADANTTTMTGGSYSLQGGFWVDFLGNRLQLPLIVR